MTKIITWAEKNQRLATVSIITVAVVIVALIFAVVRVIEIDYRYKAERLRSISSDTNH